MTTTTAHNPSLLPLLLLALTLTALVMWAAPGLADVDIDTASHAVEVHGENDVDLIHRCLDENGPEQTWWNPKTKHWVQCVKLDDEGYDWGIQVVRETDKFKEVSAFRAWEMWLDEVERYLVNRGYMQIP